MQPFYFLAERHSSFSRPRQAFQFPSRHIPLADREAVALDLDLLHTTLCCAIRQHGAAQPPARNRVSTVAVEIR